MRLLVLQHITVEHPGIFRDFLAADGVAWDAVELDRGETIPALDSYDALLVFGGPMDVWQEDLHPWLVDEKTAIHEAVAERGMPFLGVCLGHQLLAAALGGRVEPMAAPEVGVLDVTLTPAGQRSRLMRGIDLVFPCLQWHGAEVTGLPPGAVPLAHSPACGIQALQVGEAAFGVQYHVEMTGDTVTDWARIPAYAQSLEATMGPGAVARLDDALQARLPDFNADAKRLYDNFMALARRA